MVWGAYKHELLGVKRNQLKVGMPDCAPKPNLDLVPQHKIDDVLGVAGSNRNIDLLMIGDELLQKAW